jgi:RNA polymerase sigma-70 factor (sigma-E family)
VNTDEFEEFVVARSAALLRFGWLVCSDAYEAEDLVQGALAGAYRHRRRLSRHDIEPYMRRSIVNAQATRWTRSLRRTVILDDLHLPEVPHDAHSAVEDRVWALQLLRSLPPRQRAVLVMRYVYDLDEATVARELGVTRGTVKSQASKALASLRAATPQPEEAAP